MMVYHSFCSVSEPQRESHESLTAVHHLHSRSLVRTIASQLSPLLPPHFLCARQPGVKHCCHVFPARPRPAYSPADGSRCSAAFNLCHPILAGLRLCVAENKRGPILNAVFWNQPECWMEDKNINVQMYAHYLPLIFH